MTCVELVPGARATSAVISPRFLLQTPSNHPLLWREPELLCASTPLHTDAYASRGDTPWELFNLLIFTPQRSKKAKSDPMAVRQLLSASFAAVAVSVGAKEAYELFTDHPGALDLKSLIATTLCLVIAILLRRSESHGNRKPVLAVDLDEVCCGYLPAFIKYSNAMHGTALMLEDFTSYMFWEVPKAKLASREAATERVYAFHASRYFEEQVEPIAGAAIALGVLKERFDLHVVTSRQTDIEQQTRAFVAKHFPGTFTELHFGNHFGKPDKHGKVAKVSKPEMCARIGAVALIDDSIDYARQCAASGLPVFLFGDYGWNQTRAGEKLDERITRVRNWRMLTQLVTPEVVRDMRG